MSLGAWDVSNDEKDAVMAVGMLVRAVKKWDADERIKKRAKRAEDWLRRYDSKHPYRMLRDEAQLSGGSETTPDASQDSPLGDEDVFRLKEGKE